MHFALRLISNFFRIVRAGLIIIYNYHIFPGGWLLFRLAPRFLYHWIGTSHLRQFDAIKVAIRKILMSQNYTDVPSKS